MLFRHIFVLFSAAGSQSTSVLASAPQGTKNANHIFNAIHSSMRQWGSTLNHNGMSLFLATVPEGTKLYHGAWEQEVVTGTEWLAFETEHALQFTRLPMIPGSLPPYPPDKLSDPRVPKSRPHQAPFSLHQAMYEPDPIWFVPRYLHTYVAKHDIRLLYIDGSAAAKSPKGSLDSTDFLLLNKTLAQEQELQRASGLCELAATEWRGLIEGFIRMEAGFEIIMCAFEESLKLNNAHVALDFASAAPTINNISFHWLRAASARYDGIGGSPRRVRLDYDHFVTAYNSSADLFENGNLSQPRLPLPGAAVLDDLRARAKHMIIAHSNDTSSSKLQTDWQAVTDMIVQEFADPLQYLVTSSRFSSSGKRLSQELSYMLRPFIDNTYRDVKMEIQRCLHKHLPTHAQYVDDAPLAYRAIFDVSYRICSTLIGAFDSLPDPRAEEDIVPTRELDSVRELIGYLQWTEWKKCRGCDFSQICLVPLYPYGTWQDFRHPSCRSVDDPQIGSLEYWFLDDPGDDEGRTGHLAE